MTKEFKLSDKRTDAWQGRGSFIYPEKDVKEFISLIPEENPQSLFDELVRDQDLDKDEIVEIICEHFNKKINKLSGDELL